MTEQHENLSALVDGEIHEDKVLDALSHDDQLREKWQRYHLIRSTMRKEMPAGQYMDISAQIADAIEREPTVLAPNKRFARIPVIGRLSNKVVPFAKQSGQFAVAASVAAAVIIGFQTFNQPPESKPFVTAPPAAGPQGGLAPVSLEQTRALPTQSRAEVLETRRHINALIADHEQQVKLKSDSDKKNQENQESPVQ
ncbi:transcriptional regulator [Alteromonas sediminis]|uniref:Anti-sigma-E factor RseA n=1 Tax=Alteromonas sediminis TaxID=2259342 RepID=A0A3N5YA74_9ALTE|nr:RseA family anti-sigma factor [Alteromonas sediminis]RPJ65605.1 transcriptional regulator [Alteromonas sediminis]